MATDEAGLRDLLERLVGRSAWTDQAGRFEPEVWSRGDARTAYGQGVEDGETALARELLRLHFPHGRDRA